MKHILFFSMMLFSLKSVAQIDLSQFQLSNATSAAFMLVEETPTAIASPENLRALAIYALDNFGESISIEVSPYFFIGTKNTARTYYRYVGVEADSSGVLKQNPFSGLNTTSISFAYVDKEFSEIDGPRKTYSVGLRTTLLRFYDKAQVYNNAQKIADLLTSINPPNSVLLEGAEAIKDYYINEQAVNKKFEPYQKTIKPIFKLDGALGYSALFKENTIDSGTAHRFGSWLTAEGSLILNEGSTVSSQNNFINVLLTARYVEDEFNMDSGEQYVKHYYRDIGGKLELEFGKMTFGYEFISRQGSIDSDRSVGTIKFNINNEVSLIGGFGKDFQPVDNLITIFGINWGFNLGARTVN